MPVRMAGNADSYRWNSALIRFERYWKTLSSTPLPSQECWGYSPSD